MVAGLVAAEIQPRSEGHVLGLDEVLAEGVGIAAERADIGVEIEGAFRLHGDSETQLAQGRQEEVATAGELFATLFENGNGGRLETGQRGLLGHARRADVEVLRQLLQFRHRRCRRHQPAQAPAGHAEILGKTIQDESVVVDFQHRRGVHAIGQAVIDLVHHQVPAAGLQGARQAGQFVAIEQGPGRIRRRRHQSAYTV